MRDKVRSFQVLLSLYVGLVKFDNFLIRISASLLTLTKLEKRFNYDIVNL